MSEPFRFLDLSQEIQDLIHSAYYSDACEGIEIECVIGYGHKFDRASRHDLIEMKVDEEFPSLALQQVSRKFLEDSRAALVRVTGGTVELEMSELSYDARANAIRAIAEDAKWSWIREVVEHIVFEEQFSDVSAYDFQADWQSLVQALPKIHMVTVRGCHHMDLNMKSLSKIVTQLQKGQYPTDELSQNMFMASYALKNIAGALDQKLGTDGYKVFCDVLGSFEGTTDAESVPDVSGFVNMKFSVTPSGWTVYAQDQDLVEEFSRYLERVEEEKKRQTTQNSVTTASMVELEEN